MIIGRVSATEDNPSTCTSVRFWVDQHQIVRPFDVVKIRHLGRNGQPRSSTYAVIQGLEFITDSSGDLASFVSSDFGDTSVEPANTRLGMTIATAEVLHNDQEIEMPIRDGSPVEWADSDGIREAFGLKGFRRPIPAGYISMSNGEEVPIELEADYLIGPEGAHLNVAGISGLATKTSYIAFLLNSIQQTLSDEVSIVVFNVKGNDLLSIDESNPDLDIAVIDEWSKCGLTARPFDNVTYLYPYASRQESHYTSSHAEPAILAKQMEAERAWTYYYDVDSTKPKLGLLFSDIDDPNATLESIAHQVTDLSSNSWTSFRNDVAKMAEKGTPVSKDIPTVSWRRFKRLLRTRTEHAVFTERSTTQNRRQTLLADAIAEHLRPGSVIVIDIEPLPDYLQHLVVGDVIQTIYGIKLGDHESIKADTLGTVVVFADELNKYAPKADHQGSALTHDLLEITERGRFLGVVLFGAEQFRSGVHDRVLGNCSTNVFGRTNPIETAKCPDYRYFPDTYRASVSRLPKGILLLQHAVFKTPLVKVRFPHPAYLKKR